MMAMVLMVVMVVEVQCNVMFWPRIKRSSQATGVQRLHWTTLHHTLYTPPLWCTPRTGSSNDLVECRKSSTWSSESGAEVVRGWGGWEQQLLQPPVESTKRRPDLVMLGGKIPALPSPPSHWSTVTFILHATEYLRQREIQRPSIVHRPHTNTASHWDQEEMLPGVPGVSVVSLLANTSD